MKTLYLTDLDGTLLSSEANLSDFTVETVNQLLNEGILLSFATARSWHSAYKVTSRLNLTLPVIIYNGAILANVKTGEKLSINLIRPSANKYITQQFHEHEIYPMVYSFIDGIERISWLAGKETCGVSHYISSRTGDPRLRMCRSEEDLYAGDIFYYTAIGDEERLRDLYLMFRVMPHLYVNFQTDTYYPYSHWLEVYSEHASKASGAATLKELTQADRLVVFGDNLNDISMFKIADEAYAVSNAKEELKQYATAMIGDNDNGGVAKKLLELAKRP